MGIQQPNSTNYQHPWEPNLSDLHVAMAYNDAGEPVLRTVTSGVTIEGNVNVDKVRIWDGTNNLTLELPNSDGEAGQYSVPAEAYNMVFNGATWDRMRGDIANGVLVKLSNDTIAVTQSTSPWVVSGNVTTTPADPNVASLVKFADSTNMQMDATDRLRVSEAYDAWWYAPTIDKDGDYRYIESYSGTGAGSIFVQNLASIALSSGSDNSGTLTRISRRRHKMRPTISVRVSFSLNWNGYDTNVRKRAGLFTNFNGTFYQVKDDLSIVLRRRLADGTLVERTVARTDFNVDPLDGSVSLYDLRPNGPHTFTTTLSSYVSTTPVTAGGTTMYNVTCTVQEPSKFFAGLKGRITGVNPIAFNQVCMVASVSGNNVTFTMLSDPGVFVSMNSATFIHDYMFHQLVFGFDFNGNRNTKVRYFVNGMHGRQVVHIEEFDDTLSTPWENAPAISTRFEVTNTAAPGYKPSLLVSSETVTIEGPPSENRAFSTAYNNTYINYTKTQTQEFPVIGIALRTGEPYQRADLQALSFQVQDIANINPQNSGVMFWRLLLNPTIGGTVPTPTNVGRATQSWAYTASTTVSGGLELASGYVTQASVTSLPTAQDFVNLGSNIDYTDSDKLVLVVKLLAGGSADTHLVAQLNFVEYL